MKRSTNIALAISSFVMMWICAEAFGDIKVSQWYEFVVFGGLLVAWIKFTIDSFWQANQ